MKTTNSPDDLNVAIQIHNISKCYRIYNHPRDRLLQAIWGRDKLGRPKKYYQTFWALHELSFSLGRGQTLGVVGRNGSGKSTLLQLLCGTLQPTTGEVFTRGRVGALLELGSGFNPEFSGIENVFLNAALLGLSRRETEGKLDQILAFADIGNFVHQPVKTYSSGMTMRLAFAVQANIDPDILVVDEALAVGDELFQKKCYDHLSRLKEQGTAVLLVTHSCPQIIQHCDQALLLHNGQARMLAEPARVTVTYQRLMNASNEEWDNEFNQDTLRQTSKEIGAFSSSQALALDQLNHASNTAAQAWLDHNLIPQTTEIYPVKGAEITDVWIETEAGERVNILPFGQSFIIVFKYKAYSQLECIGMACHIANQTGLRISGQTVPGQIGPSPGHHIEVIKAGSSWSIRYGFHGGLWPGVYFIGGGIMTCHYGITSFVHRVVDYRAIRIIDNKPLSVVGASSLQLRPPIVEGLYGKDIKDQALATGAAGAGWNMNIE